MGINPLLQLLLGGGQSPATPGNSFAHTEKAPVFGGGSTIESLMPILMQIFRGFGPSPRQPGDQGQPVTFGGNPPQNNRYQYKAPPGAGYAGYGLESRMAPDASGGYTNFPPPPPPIVPSTGTGDPKMPGFKDPSMDMNKILAGIFGNAGGPGGVGAGPFGDVLGGTKLSSGVMRLR